MKYKGYLHFDNKMTLKEAKEYVNNIDHHQYLPFINYKLDKKKWDDNHNKKNEFRTISIPSIKDNYVYQYYNEIISKKYEEYVKENDLSDYVCAYRINLHKSNINYFNDAYRFLTNCEHAKVFVGDFSQFFDNLDHKILKDNLKEVLNVNELDNNLYKMLKSIEKASYIDLEDIIKFLNSKGIFIPTKKDKYKSICYYCEEHDVQNIVKREWFHELKDLYLKPSKEELKEKNKGIVQGSSVSGVLSNIYMINFDKEVKNILKEYKYIYKRYCDDFIIIVKDIDNDTYEKIIEKINQISLKYKITLKESKIQKYTYDDGKIKGINNNRDYIQFLGFIICDDLKTYIRQSTWDKQIHKILEGKKIYINSIEKKVNNLSFIVDVSKQFYAEIKEERDKKRKDYYLKLKRYYGNDYKNSTFGTYMSRAISITGSDEIKKSKKEYVNLVDKHIK